MPVLADRGLYIGTERSFYRVLHAHGQAHRRGRARPPQEPRPVPRLRAAEPKQVWSWDITYLPTIVRGRADSKSQRVRLRPAPHHRQQCCDVVHHRLDASPERAEPSQAQQVQGGSSQGGHHPGAIAPVAVGTLMELDVTDPLSALNTPAVEHQLQQCFWRRAQARQEQVVGVKGFAITGTAGRDFHDPAGADSDLADVLWSQPGHRKTVSQGHDQAKPLSGSCSLAKCAAASLKKSFSLLSSRISLRSWASSALSSLVS